MNVTAATGPPSSVVVGQTQQQLSSPVLSTASSLISTDSSTAAAHHQSSSDVSLAAATASSGATPVNSAPVTNHNSPSTPVVSHEYDSGFSMDSKTISPENDYKCTGSVHEKASLFERMDYMQQTPSSATTAPPPLASAMNRSESLYGRRNEEIYKACGTLDAGGGMCCCDSYCLNQLVCVYAHRAIVQL